MRWSQKKLPGDQPRGIPAKSSGKALTGDRTRHSSCSQARGGLSDTLFPQIRLTGFGFIDKSGLKKRGFQQNSPYSCTAKSEVCGPQTHESPENPPARPPKNRQKTGKPCRLPLHATLLFPAAIRKVSNQRIRGWVLKQALFAKFLWSDATVFSV